MAAKLTCYREKVKDWGDRDKLISRQYAGFFFQSTDQNDANILRQGIIGVRITWRTVGSRTGSQVGRQLYTKKQKFTPNI